MKRPRVLQFTKSAGYEHDVVKRGGDQPSQVGRVMMKIGERIGADFVESKDGRLFEPNVIGDWDAFMFFTCGDLHLEGTDKQPPISKDGKAALVEAVRQGKPFIGVHSANDTWHKDSNDPYIRMIGGEFEVHGDQQVSRLSIIDPKFPGVGNAEDYHINEEWYVCRNFSPDLHVILNQETEGMKGDMYKRPPFPSTWTRMHGEGRVFYTSLAHRSDTWDSPAFQKLIAGGAGWALGKS
jgi:type 1 glutamine amidotransferase